MRTRFILDLSMLLIYVVLMNPLATGVPLHEWLSLGLLVLLVVHLLSEWDLSVGILARFFRRLLTLSRLNLVLDALTFVVLASVLLSGLMVSTSIMPMLGIAIPLGPTWKIIHALMADAALIALGLHTGLHWRWIVRATSRLFKSASTADVTA
ncbi:MAG: DUF4405 domain-containing protein [Coriobacteriia bacterium]|nr:DUF4405 domain-containing protein [Coriobacteriia bacterium]